MFARTVRVYEWLQVSVVRSSVDWRLSGQPDNRTTWQPDDQFAMIIYGINPVLEALRAGRVHRLRVGARADRRVEEAVALAQQRGVPVERVEPAALERVARGGVHQGIVAEVEAPRDYAIGDLVAAAAPGAPLIVVLDGIEDPHNVGAILRTRRRRGRARRRAAGTPRRGARRRRGESVGRGARVGADRDGRQYRARDRGVEGGRRLDGRPRGRGGGSLRRRST